MDARALKLGLGAIFLISLASLGAIILFINPHKTGFLSLVLFSTAVLLSLFSLFAWLGFWLRKKYITLRNSDRVLRMALRQGVLAAVLATIYLWLSHFGVFNAVTALAVLFFTAGLEYYFLARHQYTNSHE